MAKALLTMLMAETTEIMERATTAGGEFALDPRGHSQSQAGDRYSPSPA